MVLDWVNGSLGSPVDSGGLAEGVDVFNVLWSLAQSETGVLGQEFFLGEVREFVDGGGVKSVVLSVLGLNFSESLLEDSESVEVFLWGGVSLVVFLDVFSEFDKIRGDLFDVVHGVDLVDGDCCEDSSDDGEDLHVSHFFVIYNFMNFLVKYVFWILLQ